MNAVAEVLAGILVLIVAVWVAVFGGTGALLAPHRGRTRTTGFLLGALLGPFGWAWMLVRARDRSRP